MAGGVHRTEYVDRGGFLEIAAEAHMYRYYSVSSPRFLIKKIKNLNLGTFGRF